MEPATLTVPIKGRRPRTDLPARRAANDACERAASTCQAPTGTADWFLTMGAMDLGVMLLLLRGRSDLRRDVRPYGRTHAARVSRHGEIGKGVTGPTGRGSPV